MEEDASGYIVRTICGAFWNIHVVRMATLVCAETLSNEDDCDECKDDR